MMVWMFYLGPNTQLSLILSIWNSTTHCCSLQREASLARQEELLSVGINGDIWKAVGRCQFN